MRTEFLAFFCARVEFIEICECIEIEAQTIDSDAVCVYGATSLREKSVHRASLAQ